MLVGASLKAKLLFTALMMFKLTALYANIIPFITPAIVLNDELAIAWIVNGFSARIVGC